MNKQTIVAGIVVLVSAIMSPLWVSYYFEDYGELRLFLECLFCQIALPFPNAALGGLYFGV